MYVYDPFRRECGPLDPLKAMIDDAFAGNEVARVLVGLGSLDVCVRFLQ